MIRMSVKGSFSKFEDFGNRIRRREPFKGLDKFGPIGVRALAEATPVESSETANSWDYEIVSKPGYYAIHWSNTHVNDGIPIAVLLQYGHASRNGSWVEGEDYINPALKPIFQQIADDMWKVVTR